MDTLKTWIATRLAWLDENIPGLCPPISVGDEITTTTLRCFPNPTQGAFTVQVDQQLLNKTYTVYDFAGRQVMIGIFKSPLNALELGHLPAGVYFLKVDHDLGNGLRFVKE